MTVRRGRGVVSVLMVVSSFRSGGRVGRSGTGDVGKALGCAFGRIRAGDAVAVVVLRDVDAAAGSVEEGGVGFEDVLGAPAVEDAVGLEAVDGGVAAGVADDLPRVALDV